MSSHPIPLVIEDLSQFARSLHKLWPAEQPGHAATLALVARAAGYRNHQTLKAEFGLEEPEAPFTQQESRRLRDALRVYDIEGRMIRWPQKTSVQGLCMAAFWAQLPARVDLSEKDVNACLKAGETFGDHVLLRRAMIENKLMTRTRDGAVYRRVERKPTPLERQLIRAIAERRSAEQERQGLNAPRSQRPVFPRTP